MHFVLYEPRPGLAARVARAGGLALNALSDYAIGPLARDGLSLRFGELGEAELRAGAAALCAAARREGREGRRGC